jgi:hypothetical protein
MFEKENSIKLVMHGARNGSTGKSNF